MREQASPRVAAAQRLALVGLLALTHPSLAATDPVDEHQLKAAFLVNFVRFVEWPPASFDGTTAPIVVCLVGDDPFGGWLDRLADSKTVNGRAMQVRRLSNFTDVSRCHALFLASADRRLVDTVLNAVRNSAVLTVGDADGFARAGGVVNFTREGTRVGFEINVTAAARARLVLSSRLLGLARIVRDENSGTLP